MRPVALFASSRAARAAVTHQLGGSIGLPRSFINHDITRACCVLCAVRLLSDCAFYTQMDVKPIAEQLRVAHEASGWSVQELLEKSGLEIDRSSLARKLTGDLPMKTREAEVLARTLGVQVVAGREA